MQLPVTLELMRLQGGIAIDGEALWWTKMKHKTKIDAYACNRRIK